MNHHVSLPPFSQCFFQVFPHFTFFHSTSNQFIFTASYFLSLFSFLHHNMLRLLMACQVRGFFLLPFQIPSQCSLLAKGSRVSSPLGLKHKRKGIISDCHGSSYCFVIIHLSCRVLQLSFIKEVLDNFHDSQTRVNGIIFTFF